MGRSGWKAVHFDCTLGTDATDARRLSLSWMSLFNFPLPGSKKAPQPHTPAVTFCLILLPKGMGQLTLDWSPQKGSQDASFLSVDFFSELSCHGARNLYSDLQFSIDVWLTRRQPVMMSYFRLCIVFVLVFICVF